MKNYTSTLPKPFTPQRNSHTRKKIKQGKTFCFMLALIFITSFSKAQLTVTLTPSNVNCQGLRTGQITANVTGGVPPYQYDWSTTATTQSIANLHGGYYYIKVYDQNGNEGFADINLSEPEVLRIVQFDATIYPNNYNTTCYNCNDGAITVAVAGGTPPYTYAWSDGSNLQNRTNLVAKDYQLVVTDAFGCQVRELNMRVNKPESDDWGKNGSNNVSTTNFIGSINSVPLVLKAGNQEGFRLMPDGKIGIGTTTPTEKFEVAGGNAKFGGDIRLSNGKILFGSGNDGISVSNSNGISNFNIGINLPPGGDPTDNECTYPVPTNTVVTNIQEYFNVFKTQSPTSNVIKHKLSFFLDGQNGCIELKGNNLSNPTGSQMAPRLLINYYCGRDVYMCTGTQGGKLYVGSNTSTDAFQVKGKSFFESKVGIGAINTSTAALAVEGTIATRGVNVYGLSFTSMPDYVFEKNYHLKSLYEVEKFVIQNKHLEGIPTAQEVVDKGLQMDALQLKQLEKIEELYLYVIELQKQNEALQQRIIKLETK